MDNVCTTEFAISVLSAFSSVHIDFVFSKEKKGGQGCRTLNLYFTAKRTFSHSVLKKERRCGRGRRTSNIRFETAQTFSRAVPKPNSWDALSFPSFHCGYAF